MEEPLKTTFQVSICSTRCSSVPDGSLPFCDWFGSGCFLNENPCRFCACFEVEFCFSSRIFADLGAPERFFIKKNLKNCELVCCPVSCVGLRSLNLIMSRAQFRWPFTVDPVGISIKLKISRALISLISCSRYFFLLFGPVYTKFGSSTHFDSFHERSSFYGLSSRMLFVSAHLFRVFGRDRILVFSPLDFLVDWSDFEFSTWCFTEHLFVAVKLKLVLC